MLNKQSRSIQDTALCCHFMTFLINHRSVAISLLALREQSAVTPRTQCVKDSKHLVDVEGLDLSVRLAHLLVAAHEHDLSDPSSKEGGDGESSGGGKSDDVARSIGLGPQVGSPDEGGVHDGGDNTNGDSLLLRSLTTGGSAPT